MSKVSQEECLAGCSTLQASHQTQPHSTSIIIHYVEGIVSCLTEFWTCES
jgi:hypothetical protein